LGNKQHDAKRLISSLEATSVVSPDTLRPGAAPHAARHDTFYGQAAQARQDAPLHQAPRRIDDLMQAPL